MIQGSRARIGRIATLSALASLLLASGGYSQPGIRGIGGQPGFGGQIGAPPGFSGQIGGRPGFGGQIAGMPGPGIGINGQFAGQPGFGGQIAGPPGFGGQIAGMPGPGIGINGQIAGQPGFGGQIAGQPGFGGGQIAGMPNAFNGNFGRPPGGIGGGMPGPGFPGGAGVTEIIWSCDKCGREVARGPNPPSLTRCPHCGVRVDHYTDERGNRGELPKPSSSDSGSGIDDKTIKIIVGIVIGAGLLVGVICAFVAASKRSGSGKKRRPRDFDRDDDDDYRRPRYREW
jgi:hypothetical protein